MTPRLALAERPARILIVDDDANNRQLLEVMLAPEGFTVQSAASGEEALRIVGREPPDLVLLDIMMPGMDGYQVATTLKSDPASRNIPIIVVTALDNPDSKLRGLDAGAEDFLTKPIDRAELRVRVRNLLRLKAYSQLLEGEVGSRTAELIESERLYRSTFDAAPVGIAHVGLDGRWLRVNQRLCDLLGYQRDELLMSAIDMPARGEASSNEAAALDAMAAGSLERQVIDEKRYRRRDGTSLWARVNISVHRNAGGVALHFIMVIEDITERRALEAKLRHANRIDAIGQLASGVAHDFNNLLSVVVSYSEMLADDLKDADPMRPDLEEIRAAGWRGVELTRQLLAFSRQEAVEAKVVDLAAIVGGMQKMLHRVLGDDVVLATSHPVVPTNVLADPGQMEQVIMNLVINARDAMPGGGSIAIATEGVELDEAYTCEHAGMSPGPHVALIVSDTGSGMDAATQARIFEPFFTTKESGKGTGLGLATVFGIVRESGGTIEVKSVLGTGTAFRVYLPATVRGVTAARAAVRPQRRVNRGTETILLVEDEQAVRALAGTILRKYGYDVLEAESPGDALLLCEQHPAPIHLLLTDVVMPRMSGSQLAQRLRSVRPTMKVLYMSGYLDEAIARHGVVDPTVKFVHKPITPAVLADKIRQTLAVEQPAPQRQAAR